MKRLRVVLRRLDAWSALLMGVLVVLAVVILLAMPGPCRTVMGSDPPVKAALQTPIDVAVFAQGGPRSTCSAVVWLHVDHERLAVLAATVHPATEGFVPGAGFTSLKRALDEDGPEAASTALAQALGVQIDGYVVLDQHALRHVVALLAPAGEARASLRHRRTVEAAWTARDGLSRAWSAQYISLVTGVPRLPEDLKVVAVTNYVLGFGHVQTNLRLRDITGVVTALQTAEPEAIQVIALPVVAAHCRAARSLRLDEAAIEQVRLAVELGGKSLSLKPVVRHVTQPARVLVVACGAPGTARVYGDEVRRRLRRSAGGPVAVDLLTVASWQGLVARTTRAIRVRPPLAMYVAPAEVRSAGGATRAAAALGELAGVLLQEGLPTVLSDPLPSASPGSPAASPAAVVSAAIRESRMPVSPLTTVTVSSASGRAVRAAESRDDRRRRAAAAGVATLVRSCWPGALAPRLASTQLGFSFAGRRNTTVGIVGPSGRAARRALAWLGVWGYQAELLARAEAPARPGVTVTYHGGMRAAALSLAGDLGIPSARVLRDDRAPRLVTFHVLSRKTR